MSDRAVSREYKKKRVMKTYTIYFNEPICHKYIGDKFNKDLKKWEYDVECETWNDTYIFYSLKPAKDLIKKNIRRP